MTPTKRDAVKTIMFAAAAFAALHSAAGKHHHVGGLRNWCYSPPIAYYSPPRDPNSTYYDSWAYNETFNQGDNLGKFLICHLTCEKHPPFYLYLLSLNVIVFEVFYFVRLSNTRERKMIFRELHG